MTTFERLADDARKIIVNADVQARALFHQPVTPGHLLLAVLEQRDSVIAREMESLGITFEAVLARYTETNPVGPSDTVLPQHLGFSPSYSTLLDHAFSNTMKREYPNDTDALGLLLALAQTGGGEATQTLSSLGLDYETIEKMVDRLRKQDSAAA